MRLVSVETGLDDIKAHLDSCGYEVMDMAECIRPVEAVVFCSPVCAGTPADRVGDGTVLVNATGRSAAEVEGYLKAKLG